MEQDERAHERRIHGRRSALLPAELSQAGRTLPGRIENIGEGGVFFATEELEAVIDEGHPVAVRFERVPGRGEGAVERLGRVLRAERYFDGTAVVRAFAIKFEELLPLGAARSE